MKRSLLNYGLLAVMFALTLSGCNHGNQDNPPADDSVYALVNIPYEEFFKSETTDGNFDAYTSAPQKVTTTSTPKNTTKQNR